MKTYHPGRHHFLFPLIRLAGLLLAVQGLHVLAERASEPSDGWRRTRFGWEHSDSLPIKPEVTGTARLGEEKPVSETGWTAPSWLHRSHRLAMPLAFAGFLGCFAPWCLLQATSVPEPD